MFRFVSTLTLLALLALSGCAGAPQASNFEVRTTGDAQVYGVYSSNPFSSVRR